MGSSLSAIYDDYDDYQWLCEKLGEKEVDIRDHFYDHASKLIKNLSEKNRKELENTYIYNKFK